MIGKTRTDCVAGTRICAHTLAVVPANAGTHTAESIEEAGGRDRSQIHSLWLWVPAFAGTTGEGEVGYEPRNRLI